MSKAAVTSRRRHKKRRRRRKQHLSMMHNRISITARSRILTPFVSVFAFALTCLVKVGLFMGFLLIFWFELFGLLVLVFWSSSLVTLAWSRIVPKLAWRRCV